MAALTFQDLISKKVPNWKTVPFALDPGPVRELAEAKLALDRAKTESENDPEDRKLKSALREAENAVLEARQAAEGVTHDWKVQSIGKAAYDELQNQHKPTKQQIDKALAEDRARPVWNTETFPPALIAACSVDPELDEDDVKKLWEDDRFNEAELLGIFFACREVCELRQIPDLGKDSGTTLY